MVDVVEWSHESCEPMAHPAVDRILQEGPGEEPSAEKSDDRERIEHANIVRQWTTRAQSSLTNRGCTAKVHGGRRGGGLGGRGCAARLARLPVHPLGRVLLLAWRCPGLRGRLPHEAKAAGVCLAVLF
jgi:hypothetical protein